jgi:hypothetical protein
MIAMDRPTPATETSHPDDIDPRAPRLEDETFARPQGTDSEPFTAASRPARPLHPVAEACRIAADKLNGFCPQRVVGEPDMADAAGLVDDLMALAAIMDPVIETVGVYAYGAIGFSARDLSLFRHQLRDALEGNATFVIEEAMRERAETRAEQDTADRIAMRRA